EKRVILAFALSIVVMYVFGLLYRSTGPPSPPVSDAQTQASTPSATTSAISNIPPAEQVAAPTAVGEDAVAEKPEEFVFETPLYIATISNVGGVLKSYKLKSFSDGEGQPLELINEKTGQQIGWPMTLVTGDKAIDEELKKAQFIGKVDG